MTEAALQQWHDSHQSLYVELAKNCGSVVELLIKIEIFGEKWTKWDWVMFFSYLACEYVNEDPAALASSTYWQTQSGVNESSTSMLVNDLFDVLDNSSDMDCILTNRTVISNFIDWVTMSKFAERYDKAPVFKLLAHVFKKFPSMWNENFMWIRHGSKAIRKVGKSRTHRLEVALKSLSRRPAEYFASPAFREDFISKYFQVKI